MGRYVIGDIHGCADEVRYLTHALPLNGGDQVVFLGDYVDRGPDSNGVVAFLISLQTQFPTVEFVFLKGNHEDMLLSYLGLQGEHGEIFLLNGGAATLASYGLTGEKLTARDAIEAIPAEHIQFLQGLKSFHIMETFLCVHAGVNPQKPLTAQTTEDMLWIRNKFIYSSHTLPHTVLFGHTPQQSVLFDLPYKVGLDTGLVYGNRLTCLDVDEKVLLQISRGKKSVTRTSAERMWNPLKTSLR
jgi:serine/threonine protein phosphatase 1